MPFPGVTLLLISWSVGAMAFSAFPAYHRGCAARPTSMVRQAKVKLVFRGDYSTQSDPLPPDTTLDDVSRFLAGEKNRDIFLSAGGTRSTRKLELTHTFEKYWHDACTHFSSSALPHNGDNDTIIAVDTQVKFPGVTLVTATVSGIKERWSEPATQHPKQQQRRLEGYEILLIAERSKVRGVPAVVWLFNKLTGYDKREKEAYYPPKQTKARSIIGSKVLTDGSLALTFELDLQVTIEFPALFLKILPASIEKMEAQGSRSILQSVGPDIEKAMKVAYDSFIEQHQSPSVPLSS